MNKKYQILLIVIHTILSSFLITYFSLTFYQKNDTFLYYEAIGDELLTIADLQQNKNVNGIVQKHFQSVDSRKGTIAYLVNNSDTLCIPIVSADCVPLVSFFANENNVLIGRFAYNFLSEYEKENNIIFLDDSTPYDIFAVVGFANEASALDYVHIVSKSSQNIEQNTITSILQPQALKLTGYAQNKDINNNRSTPILLTLLESWPFAFFVLILCIVILKHSILLVSLVSKVLQKEL